MPRKKKPKTELERLSEAEFLFRNPPVPPPPPPSPETPPPADDGAQHLPPDVSPSMLHSIAQDLREVFAELARRRVEALKLYEPLPLQDAFHKSDAPERIVRGSNRAGKTLCTHVELARAVTGKDPYRKYPREDGRFFAVGKDGKHLGDVMHRKLFRAGAFRIIRDYDSNDWRAWRPWMPQDLERKIESRPAPPLVPRRYVREIAWENKRAAIPEVVRFVTGWEANFFSSLGKPPQGSDVDGVLFDEEIVDPEWYPEMSARLLDREGKFIWGATPQAGTEQLYDLHLIAEDEKQSKRPRVAEFYLTLADNPHITQAQKDELSRKLSGDQHRIRIEGEFAVVSLRIYPEFNDGDHFVDPIEVPKSWCAYAIVDPGHQVCAVLFIAVPPPGTEAGRRKHVFDELYIPNCTADIFGREMARKCEGRSFQAFIIDGHAGRVTEMGSGRTVEAQYTEALRKHKVKSVATGHGFMWGSDDVSGRIEAVHGWLSTADGEAVLACHRGKVPNLRHEMSRYRKKQVGGHVLDQPVKKHDHLVDDLGYAAAFGCPYVKPPGRKAREGYAAQAVKAKRARERMRQRQSGEQGNYIRLGPGK